MDLLASHLIQKSKPKKSCKSLKRLTENQTSGVKKKSLSQLDPKKNDKSADSSKGKKCLSQCLLSKKKLITETLLNQGKEAESSPGKFVKLVSHAKSKHVTSNSSKCKTNNLPSRVKDGEKIVANAPSQSKKSSLRNPETTSRKKLNVVQAFEHEQSSDKSKKSLMAKSLKKRIEANHSKLEKQGDGMISGRKTKKRKLSVPVNGGGVKDSSESTKKLTLIPDTVNTTAGRAGTMKAKKSASKSIKTAKPGSKLKSGKNSILDGNITRKEVFGCVEALRKLVTSDEQGKKTLFDPSKPPIFLQVNCIKVPKTPTHQLRITLPHPIVSSEDDIALLVKDLKRGRKRDYEDTVRFYEDLLQKHKCTRVKTIIPINQIKTEYRQFEMRRRLFKSYDYFLVDGRIAGHIAHLLGKQFRQKRKLPTSIHMDKQNLSKEIDCALRKTSLQIHGNGDDSIVQIGAFTMDVDEIVDNIFAVLDDLKVNFPGGWNNLRSLRIKTPSSLSIPIYTSLKNKNDVQVPVIEPKRPKAYQTVEGELSTFTSDVNVIVSPDGSVAVRRIRENEPALEDATERNCQIGSPENRSNESDGSADECSSNS